MDGLSAVIVQDYSRVATIGPPVVIPPAPPPLPQVIAPAIPEPPPPPIASAPGYTSHYVPMIIPGPVVPSVMDPVAATESGYVTNATFYSGDNSYFLKAGGSNTASNWYLYPSQTGQLEFLDNASTIILQSSTGQLLYDGSNVVAPWYLSPSLNGEVKLVDASGTQLLQSVDGQLFYNAELLATASSIQNISDWSLYPVLNSNGVDFDGFGLYNASSIQSAVVLASSLQVSSASISSLGVASLTVSGVLSSLGVSSFTAGNAVIGAGVVSSAQISSATFGTLDMATGSILRSGSLGLGGALPPYGSITSPDGVSLLWNGSTISAGGGGNVANWSYFPQLSTLSSITANSGSISTLQFRSGSVSSLTASVIDMNMGTLSNAVTINTVNLNVVDSLLGGGIVTIGPTVAGLPGILTVHGITNTQYLEATNAILNDGILSNYGSAYLASGGANACYVTGGFTQTPGENNVIHGAHLGALNGTVVIEGIAVGLDFCRIDVLPIGIDIITPTFVTIDAGGAANIAAGGAISFAAGSYIDLESANNSVYLSGTGFDSCDLIFENGGSVVNVGGIVGQGQGGAAFGNINGIQGYMDPVTSTGMAITNISELTGPLAGLFSSVTYSTIFSSVLEFNSTFGSTISSGVSTYYSTLTSTTIEENILTSTISTFLVNANGLNLYNVSSINGLSTATGFNVAITNILDMTSNPIKNLSSGTASTDAVNVGQLTTATGFRDGTEFYVSQDGSDFAGTGGILSPYKTIQFAITQAEAVSEAAAICVINVASGHYVENLVFQKGYIILNGSLQSQTGNEVCEITGSISIALTGASDIFNRQVSFNGFNITCGFGQAVTDTSSAAHTVSFQDCKCFVVNQFFSSTSAAADMRLYMTNVEVQQTSAASALSVIVTNVGQVEFERLEVNLTGNCSAIVIGGTSVLARFSLSTLDTGNASPTLLPLLSITSSTTSTHTLGNVAFAFASTVAKTATNAMYIASGINTAIIMLNCVFTLGGTASSTNYCIGYNGVGTPTIAGINNTSLSVNVVLPQTTTVQSGITQIQYTNIDPPVLGTYSSSIDQTIAVGSTPQALTFNTSQNYHGTLLVAGTRIYVGSQGNYAINYACQLQNTGALSIFTQTFLKKNGNLVANSAANATITTTTAYLQTSPQIIVQMNSGDYIEVWMNGPVTLSINALAASGTVPASPSVLLNIAQIR